MDPLSIALVVIILGALGAMWYKLGRLEAKIEDLCKGCEPGRRLRESDDAAK